MKLIKLTNDHYIIVNDSEIKIGDIVLETYIDGSKGLEHIQTLNDIDILLQKKVTHSTQPLEGVNLLNLSEVEEAINGYSVKKMAVNYCNKHYKQQDWEENYDNYCEGFKAHQELVKDKLFTIEQLDKTLRELATEIVTEDGKLQNCSPSELFKWVHSKIQSLLPKTEWDIEFDENGKIKLL